MGFTSCQRPAAAGHRIDGYSTLRCAHNPTQAGTCHARQTGCMSQTAAHGCEQLAASAITAASKGLREPQVSLHTMVVCLPCSTPALETGAVHARAAGIPCEHLLRAHTANHRSSTGSTAESAPWRLVHRDLGTAAAAAEHTRNCADQVTLRLHCTSRVAADGIRTHGHHTYTVPHQARAMSSQASGGR